MANLDTGAQVAQAETFRQYLPDLSTPRFQRIAECDAYSHAAEALVHKRPPWLYGLLQHWMSLLKEPYRGVTNDGTVRHGLFKLRDEGIPIAAIAAAADAVIAKLGPEQRKKTLLHVDNLEGWRTWSNPEFLISDKGVRLDELSEDLRNAVLKVLEASLSAEGYQKALGAMRVNHFLGELVNAHKVMNEFSYNFVLFGLPSTDAPWGYSFYGHHLCLSVFFYGPQIVVSPWFTGAEPNIIDEGPYKGTRILYEEDRLGLQLMQSLSQEDKDKAQTYKNMKDDKMPKGRWNHDDQRHLLGAYRDNRTVPYEGIVVSSLSEAQQALVLGVLEQYLLYLPARSRALKLQDCRDWLHETYFSWIGGYGDADAFYFRIQSPVVIVEFDHHSGVFLTNTEPKRFHIHTLLRTPHRGDYGMALRELRRPAFEGEVNQDYVWEG
ncbi:hypothetical protein JX265_010339 [Neoarthrinium moseri]|uniref:Uncharacterized protein n=1 Tax=Neoarthrinium moseri TaxID=1658444 RepID=A0A9Q0AIE2_9PEZI|nr:uncharacterized protein JN550_012602 [Neoarthrinium moseri]KAI1858469.1 hypothetical protein JN550_012602 [Neoarthrinium moseri]KAI1859336.1 hypothetical protein JX265_010339 [Neoarthrinium moseri]